MLLRDDVDDIVVRVRCAVASYWPRPHVCGYSLGRWHMSLAQHVHCLSKTLFKAILNGIQVADGA